MSSTRRPQSRHKVSRLRVSRGRTFTPAASHAQRGERVAPDPKTPLLSVVIPMYREADRIESMVAAIAQCRELSPVEAPSGQPGVSEAPGAGEQVEYIFVDDGSPDDTVAVLERAAERLGIAYGLLRLPQNGGKGAAVAAGSKAATGTYVAYIDADVAVHPSSLPPLVAYMAANDIDIAVGDRTHPKSHVVRERAGRRAASWAFNSWVQALGLSDLGDTQCGCKIVRRCFVAQLYAGQIETGFAFDVELLYRAKLAGLKISSVPVDWVKRDGSTVSPIRDGIAMASSALRVRRSKRMHQPGPQRLLHRRVPSELVRPGR
ncbi:MAG: glycosyltransferase [Acidimicrobiia bacterium]|nr:glycosyltransferase [Acidimicrobiia bacterium]